MMSNKYLYMVTAGVVTFFGYFLGVQAFFQLTDSFAGLSEDWWLGLILAAALGAGNTGGDNIISIFVEGITGYFSTLLALAVLSAVGGLLYGILFNATGIDPMLVLKGILNVTLGALHMNLMASYLKKAI